MSRKEFLFILFLSFFISAIFFYKLFIYGLVPIPGDLLISEYNPWRNYSYFGYNPGSFPNKAQYFDVLRQLYPWKTLAINFIKQMQVPLWNPYNFSGTPLLANFQSTPFYPLNILYLFLPQVFSWSILVFAQPCLALIFTYFYVRKLGVSIVGSVFSAISFAFSSFMTVWLEYNTIGQVILWLPLILLSIENLLKKRKSYWILIFIFSMLASLLGGHPQIFVYLFAFVLIYTFYRVRRFSYFFLFLFLIPLLLGAFQLLSTLELLMLSARGSYEYNFFVNKVLIQPYQLIMLFVPDFFGNPATRNYWLSDTYVGKVTSVGLVPLFFILFTVIRKKNIFSKFFISSALLVLLATTLNPFTTFLYRFNIPFISSSAPTLMIFIFCFSLSILTGFGVDLWIKKSDFKKNIKFISPIIILFVFLWAGIFILKQRSMLDPSAFQITLRNLFYSTVLVGAGTLLFSLKAEKTKTKYLILLILLLIQVFDLGRSFEKFNPFSPKESIFPNTDVFDFIKQNAGINRFWGYGSAYVEANFATEYQIFSPEGYDPLYSRRYGELMESARDGKIGVGFTRENRSDAVIKSGFRENIFSKNSNSLKALNLLGVKYILDRAENGSSEKTFPPDRFRLVYDNGGWKIFENLSAFPRAFLTSDYKVFETNKDFEKNFSGNDFGFQTVFLEENIGSLGKKDNDKSLKTDNYSPNNISFSTNSTSSNLLYLSDNFYPGWKAFVDGTQTKIYRANYSFRAVKVPGGKHSVVFTFDPYSLKIGLGLSLAGLLGILLFIVFSRKNE